MRNQGLDGTALSAAAAVPIAGGAAAQDENRMMKPSIPVNGCNSAHSSGIVDIDIDTRKLNRPAVDLHSNSLEGL